MKPHKEIISLLLCCAIFILCSAFSISIAVAAAAAANNDTETGGAIEAKEVESLEDILNKTFPENYDKHTRPMIRNDTFNVEVAVYVEDMARALWSDFLELILTLKVSQSWTDNRLRPFTNNQGRRPRSSLVVPAPLQERFWRPDTGFGLDEEQKILFPVLEVHSNGTVNFEQVVVTKIYCPVEYTLFPMDQPNCTLLFGSSSDTSLRYRWKEDRALKLDYFPRLPLPGLIVLGYTCRGQVFDGYYHLLLDIFLQRRFFYYLTRFYLPSFFVVVIAFLPLYLTPESHSRVGLGVSSVLTITMLLNTASSELPNIGQLTLMDIYLFFSFFAVFLSVVEYALIGYYDVVRSREEELKAAADKDKNKEQLSKDEDKMLRKIELAEKRSTDVDHLSQQIFPASFAIFNVVYAVACVGILMYNSRAFIEYKVV